ncbi:uncharacterized protein LOC144553857 [Carex rostrata]
MGLLDIPLKNRKFTWSSKRPEPIFSKLDRVFASSDWTTAYPVVTLEALEIVVSDHAPILLTCKGLQHCLKRPELECFWFCYETPKAMIQQLWCNQTPKDGIANFHNKTKLLHKALSLWQQQTFGILEKEVQNCKDSILLLDRMEEIGPLDSIRFSERIRLRERAFELANNIELRWRQWLRCNWLAQGDNNTRFFSHYGIIQVRRNLVLSIEDNGNLVSD